MADHARETITLAFIAAVTGLTTTGANVFRDRDTEAQPLQKDEVPGLTVEDDGEPAELITMDASGILERTMAIRVSAHVKALDHAATLNKILKEIEIAVAAASMGGAKYAYPSLIGQRQNAAGGDTPVVRQDFNFTLLYYTAQSAPDAAL